MVLKGKFKVLGIKKKTKAVMFREFKVGDEVEVTYSLNGGGGYAPTVLISHNGRTHWNDISQFNSNMQNFEI